jgi:hypothetical protein
MRDLPQTSELHRCETPARVTVSMRASRTMPSTSSSRHPANPQSSKRKENSSVKEKDPDVLLEAQILDGDALAEGAWTSREVVLEGQAY